MEPSSREVVLQACRRLTRPLVRLMVRSGVTWKDFAEVAKAVFVDVAVRDFRKRGRPTNSSRVAILTGINRREVRKVRDALAKGVPATPTYLNAAQRLLSGWYQDPDFRDAADGPLTLPLEGESPSFAELWRRYGGDVPMRALLKELIAVGSVARSSQDMLRAVSRTYIPLQMDPAKILRAGSVLEDIGATVVHDLIRAPRVPLRFERRAQNDRIDVRCLPEFRQFLEREGMAFLERVDDWLTAHEARTESVPTQTMRLGVGLYHLQDEAAPRKPQ